MTISDLRDWIVKYQRGKASALDVSEWALRAGQHLPGFFHASLDVASLVFFLERLSEQGPTFAYTFDTAAFDALVSGALDAITGKAIWREIRNNSIPGRAFLSSQPETVGRTILSSLDVAKVEEDAMYDVQYDAEFLGEKTTIGNVRLCHVRSRKRKSNGTA